MSFQEEFYDGIYKELFATINQQGQSKEQIVSNAFGCMLRYRFRLYTFIFLNRYQERVAFGPFRGMHFPREIVQQTHAVPSYILGCYEEELHPVIWKIANTPYDIIIDIGCATGYYAVGLARMMPHIKMYAFDTDPVARQLCSHMAHVNQVADRVIIDTVCDYNTLNKLQMLPGRKLILCDIEGAEYDLLDPDRIPMLKALDILVETHQGAIDFGHDVLIKRFANTHHIQHIPIGKRDWTQYPDIEWIPLLDRDLIFSDARTIMSPWLFLTQRSV